MATYNGHRSWAAWNVALWINNDEPIYREAVRLCAKMKSRGGAARALMVMLPAKTPDGARYTVTSVIEALRGI